MSRFGAFGVHVAISGAIFLVLAAIVAFVWYPDFFFATDGGWQGIRIIVIVDMVLGPLLTLIVFKPGKPGLKTDLTLIGLFQAVCLAGGITVVYLERPVALVYVDGYFYSVTEDDLRDVGRTSPFSPFDRIGPAWVMVDIPRDFEEQSEFRRAAMQQNLPLRFCTERYVPFDPKVAFANEPPQTDAFKETIDDPASLDAFLAANPGGLETYRFVPYGARYAVNHLVFRRADDALVGVIDAQPI